MKHLKFSLLAGALLVFGSASSSVAQVQQTQGVTASAPFSRGQTVWAEVRDNSAYLDGLIAQKKLNEVHAAAFNLRDSVRMLRGVGENLSAVARDTIAKHLSEVDVLANAMDATGDKNDLRGTVANQRQMHVALDELAGLFPQGTLAPVGAVTMSGPVKDPVCRMTVDPATAPERVAFQGQTYYFCSIGDAKTFEKAPAKYAALYEEVTFGAPKTFAISLADDGKARAGRPELLTFAVRETGKDAVVKDFQLVHEKMMHLIVVSDDLSYFSHEHPQLGKDGRFRLKWTFPHAGRYFLFSDFTPGDGLNQILRTQITVDSGQPKSLPRLVPDTALSKIVDGYAVSLKLSAPLTAGKTSLLTYTITRNGRAVTDMEPYLGAMGHLMAVNQNGRDVVHTHTVSAGDTVTNEMATQSGPRFTYDLIVAAPGVTRIWAQFQRGGKILTVPFTLNVGGQRAIEPAMKVSAPASPTRVQKVVIALPAGYRAGAATVKAGVPVTLVFQLRKDAGCGNTIKVPSANWKKTLKVGESASVTFTPQKSGPLTFACGMDMLHGTIIVK